MAELTELEKQEIEEIMQAVYTGNIHRRPELDVRWLLQLIERLTE